MGMMRKIREWWFDVKWDWKRTHHHYDESIYDPENKFSFILKDITMEDWECIWQQYVAENVMYGTWKPNWKK